MHEGFLFVLDSHHRTKSGLGVCSNCYCTITLFPYQLRPIPWFQRAWHASSTGYKTSSPTLRLPPLWEEGSLDQALSDQWGEDCHWVGRNSGNCIPSECTVTMNSVLHAFDNLYVSKKHFADDFNRRAILHFLGSRFQSRSSNIQLSTVG